VALIAVVLAAATGCGGGGGEGRTGGAGVTQTAATKTTAAVTPELRAKVRHLISLARQAQGGASRQQSIRVANAQAELLTIAQRNPAAIAPLISALKKPDYELILDLYSFYIQLGRPGSQKALLATLNHEGFTERSSPMAFAFLASGNKVLVAGTRRWAAANGLTITGSPGGLGPKWGQTGLPAPSVPTAPPVSP
jgi:hypothetical protein